MSRYRDPLIQVAENLKCSLNSSHNVGLYTLRRWTNVKPILIQRLVSAWHDVSTRACNLEVPGSNADRAQQLPSWLCIYFSLYIADRFGPIQMTVNNNT